MISSDTIELLTEINDLGFCIDVVVVKGTEYLAVRLIYSDVMGQPEVEDFLIDTDKIEDLHDGVVKAHNWAVENIKNITMKSTKSMIKEPKKIVVPTAVRRVQRPPFYYEDDSQTG